MASVTQDVSRDASSLRAAALLTIKAKVKPRPRTSAEADRHHDDTSSVASTRRAAPSPELNYGSDDGLADAEGSTEEEEEEGDKGGEKEEGEISEDEAAAASKNTRTTMMDVDDEPLPGLTSSRPKVTDEPNISRPKGQKATPLPPKHTSGISALTTLSITTSSQAPPPPPLPQPPPPPHSTSAPGPPRVPTSVAGHVFGSRLSNSGPAPKALNSQPRAPSISTKPDLSAPPAPDSMLSRFVQAPSPQRDIGRRATVPMLGNEQSGLPKPHGPPSSTAAAAPSQQTPPDLSRSVVDNTHARPSLNLTAQEFMEAKTIILDLLGWGVPSDYFINCGLTRESIYYAFSEMNLKLPSNLNTDGIVPYGPPSDYAPVSSSMEPDLQATRDQNQSSAPTPPVELGSLELPPKVVATSSASPGARDRRTSVVAPSTGPVKLGITLTAPPHPLPPKPMSATSPPSSPPPFVHKGQPTSQQISSGPSFSGHINTGSNGFTPNQPSSSQHGSIPGLQFSGSTPRTSQPPPATRPPVIAQATLPVKPSGSFSSATTDTPTHGYTGNLDEIETLRRQELQARKAVLASRKPKSLAATTTGLVQGPSPPRPKSPPRPAPTILNDKPSVPPETVDDFLKSITSGASTSNGGDKGSYFPLTRSPDSTDMDMDVSPTDDHGPTSAGMRPSRQSSLSFVPSTTDSQSIPGPSTYPPRKGSNKRPVAADFVDYDAPPPARESPFASSAAHNGNYNGRRILSSTPSFANLAVSRKLIIDFSDDDDGDGDDDVVESRAGYPHNHASGYLAPVPQGGPRSASVSTPEPNTPAPTPNPAVAPAALLAKEQEIKKMKELIAERERNRLKKLSNPPMSMTPPLPPPPPPSSETLKPSAAAMAPPNEAMYESAPSVASIKQEDDAPAQPSRLDGHSSTTSAAGDVIEEDAVMHDIFAPDASSTDMSTTSTPPSTDPSTGEVQHAENGEHGKCFVRIIWSVLARLMRGVSVLTVEAGQEQVVDTDTEDDPSQVEDTSLQRQPTWIPGGHEAQFAQDKIKPFLPYTSPLSSFASFRSPSQGEDLSTIDTSSTLTSSLSSLSAAIPVSQQLSTLLRPLKQAALQKLDPKRSICQFEIPGAGKCRDSSCPNVHLRALEPNDEDTARYLAKALPVPQPATQEVKAALSRVRTYSKQELDLDTRVSQALLQLGVR